MKKTFLAASLLATFTLQACGTNNGGIQGEIDSIDLSGVAADGPAVITIETVEGETEVIHVPSMGRNLCVAEELADVYTLKVGETIEVNGETNEEGAIVPCESESHYLRVVNN